MSRKKLLAINIALLFGMLGVTAYILKRVRKIEKFLFDYSDDIDDEELRNLANEFNCDDIKNAPPTEE